MASPDKTLIVKHLPAALTTDERAELLRHFGAEHVQCMSDNSHMRYTAFATFPDCDAASLAVKRLHQLEILGCKLSVEFSKPNFRTLHSSFLDSEREKSVDEKVESQEKKENLKTEIPPLPETVNSLDSKLVVNHPLNPKLKYLYPPPTVSILTNIANALASVPRFYLQVLHLMNKMNLPAPFGPMTATPPVVPEQPVGSSQVSENLGEDVIEEEEMLMSSTEESELESDSGEVRVKPMLPLKRQKRQLGHKPKRPKLQKVTAVQKTVVSAQIKPEDVFEPVDGQGSKKIEFKIRPGTSVDQGGGLPSLTAQAFQPGDVLDVLEKTPTVGGFGKIEPMNVCEKERDYENESDSEKLSEFVSASELKRNCLSKREMREYSVFKNYDPGEPSSRLYVKNLHRHVTEKELKYLFGRYVDWSEEAEVNMFDVRLMTEGRMKGQAFVTLGSDKIAARALQRINGYLLHDKPMVISFARSVKAKEPSESDCSMTSDRYSNAPSSDKRHALGKDGDRSHSRNGDNEERNNHHGQRHCNSSTVASKLRTDTAHEHEKAGDKVAERSSGLSRSSSHQQNFKSKNGTSGLQRPSYSVHKGADNAKQVIDERSANDSVSGSVSNKAENIAKSSSIDSSYSTHDPAASSSGFESLETMKKHDTPPYFADGPETPPHISPSVTPPHPHRASPCPPQVTQFGNDELHVSTNADTPVSCVEDEQFVTDEMLESNRLSESEKLENKVFKNYKRGEPSCKLYVKNLNHKLVTEEDIVYIFGKFVRGFTEDVTTGLDIKLLKEGRMKGQAFITYQTTEEAEKALDCVNGYKLHDKPMVIQFGRS